MRLGKEQSWKPDTAYDNSGLDSEPEVSAYSPPGTSEARIREAKGRIRLPSLGLRFSERKILLFLVDLTAINAALLTWLTIRQDVRLETPQALIWFSILSIVWVLFSVFLSVYDLGKAASVIHSTWSTCGAAVLTSVSYLLIPLVTPVLPEHRVEILLLPALGMLFVGFWRLTYATVFVQPAFRNRALVVGAGNPGQAIVRAITSHVGSSGSLRSSTGYELLGFVDDEVEVGSVVEGIEVLGSSQGLVGLAEKLQPDELILAINRSQRIHDQLFEAIADCREMGISIVTMVALYEQLTGRVPLEHESRSLSVMLPLDDSPAHRLYVAFRRTLDVFAGLAGCLLVMILTPLIWLGNRLTSPGQIFYRQDRVGQSRKTFRLVKFRSMLVEAEKDTGAVWAEEADARVTPIGRLLRKTRLDELPQFWNVLRGDMSLIGPRPERPEFIDRLSEEIPYYRVRHAVKPGITGWAQVRYRYGSSVQDTVRKLQYDLYYIKHFGPYLDLIIVIYTIREILRLRGR